MMTRKNKTTATGKRREERLEVYKHTHAVRNKRRDKALSEGQTGSGKERHGTAEHSERAGLSQCGSGAGSRPRNNQSFK